eukprot:gene6356-9739_t
MNERWPRGPSLDQRASATRALLDRLPSRDVEVTDGFTVKRRVDRGTLRHALAAAGAATRLRVRLGVVGDERVGKTSLVRKWAERFEQAAPQGKDRRPSWAAELMPVSGGEPGPNGADCGTVGADTAAFDYRVSNVTVKVTVWDLSGSAKLFEVRNEFYRECSAVVLCFAADAKKSFSSLKDWLHEIRRYSQGVHVPVLLVSIFRGGRSQVPPAEAAALNSLQFCEVDLSSSDAVGGALDAAVSLCLG